MCLIHYRKVRLRISGWVIRKSDESPIGGYQVNNGANLPRRRCFIQPFSGAEQGVPAMQEVDEKDLLRELVAHLRQHRTELREEWARRITDAKLLTAMSREEIFAEATSVYNTYVETLETGTLETLHAKARNLSERVIPRGVETHEVVGIVLR